MGLFVVVNRAGKTLRREITLPIIEFVGTPFG